jgi:hypothetical protein
LLLAYTRLPLGICFPILSVLPPLPSSLTPFLIWGLHVSQSSSLIKCLSLLSQTMVHVQMTGRKHKQKTVYYSHPCKSIAPFVCIFSSFICSISIWTVWKKI